MEAVEAQIVHMFNSSLLPSCRSPPAGR